LGRLFCFGGRERFFEERGGQKQRIEIDGYRRGYTTSSGYTVGSKGEQDDLGGIRIRSEVELFLTLTIDDEMILQCKGREEELVETFETLRTVQERAVSQRAHRMMKRQL
jgi:hypothetical protein